MDAAWIPKNYGDDLYLQCIYTCIQVVDRRVAHASNATSLTWLRREQATLSTPFTTQKENCSSEHASVKQSAASAFSSTRVCP
uniref:Uncharacterized protein n=1 Tax=Angiostrongylus cantonensis TaxID=6313 RepID=A0A0K0D693_ANGCA